MKNTRKMIALITILMISLTFAACKASDPASDTAEGHSGGSGPVTLNIGYSYGLAYAPLVLCQEKQLIEKAYSELTGNTVHVVWNQIGSGADINTGMASGSLDVGFLGIGPVITGASKNDGFKIFTNLSGQEHGLMTSNPDISSLGDLIGSPNQIALPNTGSIQHIILGMALEANGYDAHALDSNLVALKHPDGMAALESGNVSCNLTTNPYIYIECKNKELHELDEVKNVWTADRSFIVGVTSTSLHDDNPDLYQALCSAVSESIDLVNNDLEAAAKITCKYDGNSYEDELLYLRKGNYSASVKGILSFAKFMYKNKFLEKDIASLSELAFDNVSGD